MNKEIKKIFLVLALFSLSGGIFYNFQELWMADNNLSIKTISVVFSLCALLTVSTIFLCSNIIAQKKIKKFTCFLLLLKAFVILALFFLNDTGLSFFIKFLIMLDYVIDVEIYACIYPMITLISKNDKIFAARGLVYSGLYYSGVFLTSLLLGKSLSFINIDYNFYVLIGAILIFLAFLVLWSTKLEKYYPEGENEQLNILFKLVKKLKTDKISITYLLFSLSGQISYCCVLGLMVTLLTSSFDFTPVAASNLNLVLGVSAVVFGFMALGFLTFKNDYITLSIKYVLRTLLYLVAVIMNTKLFYLIALIYPKFISESYTHITDAPYVNRFAGEYQLAFCNLKEMINYGGKAIGTLLCGMGIAMGLRSLYFFAFAFALVQCTLSFVALYLRKKEVNVK